MAILEYRLLLLATVPKLQRPTAVCGQSGHYSARPEQGSMDHRCYGATYSVLLSVRWLGASSISNKQNVPALPGNAPQALTHTGAGGQHRAGATGRVGHRRAASRRPAGPGRLLLLSISSTLAGQTALLHSAQTTIRHLHDKRRLKQSSTNMDQRADVGQTLALQPRSTKLPKHLPKSHILRLYSNGTIFTFQT